MLSKQITKYRKQRKLSKEELAKITGISTRNIYFLEDGQIKNPKLNTLIKLSKGLGVEVEELIK